MSEHRASPTAASATSPSLRPPMSPPRWFWPAVAGASVLTMALRFLILDQYWRENPFAHAPTVDALTYWNWAGRIAAGEWREPTPFFSAPLYPYVLAVIRAAGGGLGSVYAFQIVLDGVTTALLAHVARRRFGPGVGVVAAALYALMLDPASFSVRVLTSTLQTALICVAWLSILAVRDTPDWRRHIFAGVALGLLSLAHPPVIYMLPIVCLWLAWVRVPREISAARKSGRSPRDSGENRPDRGFVARAARPLATLVVAAAVIAPATIHNYLASGGLFPIQASLGVNFRQGNGPGAFGVISMVPGTSADREALFHESRRTVAAALGHEPTWAEVDRFFRDQALQYWRDDAARAAALFAKKAYWFFMSSNYGDIYTPTLERADGIGSRFWLTPITTPLLLSVALVGLAVMLRRPTVYLPELLFFGTTLATVVVFWYSPRYRLPAIPVIVVAAAWTLCRAVRWPDGRTWAVAAAAMLALHAGLTLLAPRITFAGGREFDSISAFRPLYDEGQAVAWNRYGADLFRAGRVDDAAACFEKSVAKKPDFGEPHANLGQVAARRGQDERAVAHFLAALRASPLFSPVWRDLAAAYERLGRDGESQRALSQVSEATGRSAALVLAELFERRRDFRAACDVLERAQREARDDALVANALAWLLATCPDDSVRNGPAALRFAESACRATNFTDVECLDTLAAANAEAGRFERAASTARRAADMARAGGRDALAERITSRQRLFEQRRPYHEE